MRIVCIGGGPAGLYFGLLMKKQNPAHEVTVVERNRPDDTFGWGVVFSDQTLGNLRARRRRERERDPRRVRPLGRHRDPFQRRARMRPRGHGFCGIGRKRLLNILQARARRARRQARLRDAGRPTTNAYDADLIVACDGAEQRDPQRSTPRPIKPDIDMRDAASSGSAPTSSSTPSRSRSRRPNGAGSRPTPIGSTTRPRPSSSRRPSACWRAAGLDEMSKEDGIAFCERLFAELSRRPRAACRTPRICAARRSGSASRAS